MQSQRCPSESATTLHLKCWVETPAIHSGGGHSAQALEAGTRIKAAPFRGLVKNVTKVIEARTSIRINTVPDNLYNDPRGAAGYTREGQEVETSHHPLSRLC